jgi:hypothetical protein
VPIEDKIMGYDRRISKLQYPYQFWIKFVDLDVHQVDFQKIFFLTETVMGCLYSSWPECRKSDYIGDFFVLLHLAAKNEGAAEAFRFPP